MLFWDLRIRKEDGSAYSSFLYPHSLSWQGFGDVGFSASFPPWVSVFSRVLLISGTGGTLRPTEAQGLCWCDRLYKDKFG